MLPSRIAGMIALSCGAGALPTGAGMINYGSTMMVPVDWFPRNPWDAPREYYSPIG